MSKNWKTYKLSEVTTKIGSGATPRGGKEAYKDSGTSLIRSQNILDFKFTTDGLAFIDDTQASKLNNVTIEENDVLLNITGDSVARVCSVPKEFLPARVNQHVAILRADNESLDSNYLKYSLLEISYKNLLLTLASAGATRNALTKSMIEDFELFLPSISEQKAIANILSAIDDKIENNLAINNTLEDMAMALYKHWFVDFGPFQDGAFVESELELIPEGWEVKRVKDFGTVVCGKTPLKKKPEYYEYDDYPFIKIPDMHGNVWVLNTNEYISEKGNESQIKKLLPAESINVSCIATVGLVTMNINPSHTNQQINSIVPSNIEFRYYLYLTMINLKETFLNEASGGSATLNMNTSTFSNVELINPNHEVISNFHKDVSPLFDNIKNNQIENETLTKLRDTLLPKLISGEVRLKEFQEQVENII
ncbi:restriction endonuclease subunit S [Psychroserpens sp. Hel_I_66]|uniref:restriction endonuclease subunit S n=1 Tax=Psychroserpens sp. Hel_I_66 TaxID=1250004 RepID=UPI00068C07FC|nr:restriction endonuclease subunit S [Psychroserpens sp. Hel_I_66]